MSGTDVTTDTVLAANGTVARTLGSITADAFNLKNLGALLNGLTSDETNIQSAYNSVSTNSTINVPIGNFPPAWSINSTAGKSIFWNCLGTWDYATFTPGTHPVSSSSLGDGDIILGFQNGAIVYQQMFTNNSNIRSTIYVNYTNNTTAAFGTADNPMNAVQILTTTTSTSKGSTDGLVSRFTSSGQNNSSSFDVAGASIMSKFGNNFCWAFIANMTDASGAKGDDGQIYSVELDLIANGQETGSSYYDVVHCARTIALCAGLTFPMPGWASGAYVVGAVVQGTSGGVAYIYKCTTGGTSGSTAPSWPSSGSVSDGSVVWTFHTTFALQVGNGVYVGANTNVSIGTPFAASGAIFNAGMDLSQCTLISPVNKGAGIRLAANMGIDFSANGTAAAQNLRQLIYTTYAGSNSLEYINSVGAVFLASDTGTFTVPGRFVSGFGNNSNLNGISTGYNATAFTIGQDYQNAAETDFITSFGGFAFFIPTSAGVISTPLMIGNASGLSVNGTLSVNGNINANYIKTSIALFSASGSGFSGAIQLNKQYNCINAGTGGVILPNILNTAFSVFNITGATITIYTPSGATAGTLTNGNLAKYLLSSTSVAFPA